MDRFGASSTTVVKLEDHAKILVLIRFLRGSFPQSSAMHKGIEQVLKILERVVPLENFNFTSAVRPMETTAVVSTIQGMPCIGEGMHFMMR